MPIPEARGTRQPKRSDKTRAPNTNPATAVPVTGFSQPMAQNADVRAAPTMAGIA